MKSNSQIFLEREEENFYQEKEYLSAEKEAYLRNLWKEIEDEDNLITIEMTIPIKQKIHEII